MDTAEEIRVKLATFDLRTGSVRNIHDGEETHLVYGLDDSQFMRVIRRSQFPGVTPPDTVPDERTGIPLRPLYINVQVGKTMRAVPISWTEGYPYQPS